MLKRVFQFLVFPLFFVSVLSSFACDEDCTFTQWTYSVQTAPNSLCHYLGSTDYAVVVYDNDPPGDNLDNCAAGTILEWTGDSCDPNCDPAGGWDPAPPAPNLVSAAATRITGGTYIRDLSNISKCMDCEPDEEI